MACDLRPSAARSAALVLLVAFATLLPALGRGELQAEEGRRAQPAVEMLSRGHWIVPTIWERAYLAKPPLHPWTIALLSLPAGEVTPLTARLPSVLATAASALLLLAFLRPRVGARAALAAALLLLLSPHTLAKGRLGEIEPLLGFALLATQIAWWTSLEGGLGRALVAGVALGAALLAKGPPALLFLLAPAILLALLERERARRIASRTALVLAVGLLPALWWALAVTRQLPAQQVLAEWGHEVTRAGDLGIARWLADRPRILVGPLVGLAPATFLALALARRGDLARVRASALGRLALAAVAAPLAVLAVWPGAAARYAQPIGPWVALAGATALERALARQALGPRAPLARRLRLALFLLALFLGAAALIALGAAFRPHPALAPGPAGGVAAAGALVAGAFTLRALRRRSRAALGALALAGTCLALAQLADFQRRKAHRWRRLERAARIAGMLPPQRPLRVTAWRDFDLLFHLPRPKRWLADPTAAAPGEYLLVGEEGYARLVRERPFPFTVLWVEASPKGGTLRLVRAERAGNSRATGTSEAEGEWGG